MSEWKNAISKEVVDEVTSLLRGRWQDFLIPGEAFVVDAKYVETELSVSLTLMEGPRGAHYSMDAGIDWEKHGLVQESAFQLLLDLLDGYVGDYLENERKEQLPLDWQPIEVEGRTIRVRGSLGYPNLEEEANALLGDQE